MSINSLTGNPSVLLELSTALNLISPTTGITVLNGDNNITTTVTGNTGAVKLNSEIEVSEVSTNTLIVDTFTNPWVIHPPSSDGQVLSSTTGGALSWVSQSGGDGGITTINTTNANLTASATADPTVWNIGLSNTLTGLENLTIGNGVNTGITIAPGSTGITMNDSAIIDASMTNPFIIQPSSDGQVLSSTTGGVLSWVNQTGGDGGIQSIATTNGNLTAVVDPDDPTQWNIGLYGVLVNLLSVTSDIFYAGGGAPGSGVIIGNGGILQTNNMLNPFSIQPTVTGQVLSSDTDGNLTWVNQTGGDGGITTINTTNTNLTASATADPAVWDIGLNPVVEGLTTLVSEQISCGLDGSPDTGLNIIAGSGGIFMNASPINQVNYIGNLSTDTTTSVDLFSNWDVGAGTWGGEVYLDNTGVYIDSNSSNNSLHYDSAGNLYNFNVPVSYPPTQQSTWSVGSEGQAQFSNIQTTGTGISINNNGVLLTNNMINPFSTQPTVSGQVLSCNTAGDLTWVGNGSGSSSGTLVSLGSSYTALTLQQNSPFVYILPTTQFNGLAQAGMVYYINLSNFTILNNGSVDSLTIGIYLNGADPIVGGVGSSLQTLYTTGSYTTISSILQYTIQSPADTFAIYVGAAGATISTVTGGSYTITGVMP